ncbi:MAG: PfkB family carbohydrate kinase [Bacteroidota bacterium]|nr:PfkB family carbohydrate kinase [Bacteroidota bacterium]
MRNGILAAGNFIIDIVKMIDVFPLQDSLANILSESQSNGGSPYNILKDLNKMGAKFPLTACGLVGNDDKGRYIEEDCKKHNIDTQLLQNTNAMPTSYTDVMTVQKDGRRTFFHNRGSNALFGTSHIQLEQSNAKIFHLAYLMLLDALDKTNNDGCTGASQVFKKAKSMGFITSTDMVSENSGRFKDTVTPSFPYVDYLFINEYEAEKITGIVTKRNGNIDKQKCIEACFKLIEMGINQYVVMHFPEACIAVSASKEITIQPSLKILKEKIKGSVGAGDAFAAGILYGIHENWPIEKSLKLGVATAASCLFEPTCSDGILDLPTLQNLENIYSYNEF